MSHGIDFAISCIVSDEKSISLIVYWTASSVVWYGVNITFQGINVSTTVCFTTFLFTNL